jgi:hypothetical protein
MTVIPLPPRAGPAASRRWARRLAAVLGLLVVSMVHSAEARASVVEHGYLPLSDKTLLSYTVTLPSAHGRFPVVLQYDPYSAGVTSDPSWNADGYAMLGVNFRGTGCSQGVFQVFRGDIWGRDGAQVVAWAAKQPWSTGSIGMISYSFGGTSQLATAAFASPALKAITPENVFPDMYRDIIYPGAGIYNGWIPAWIAARNFFPGLGETAFEQSTSDPTCAASQAQQGGPDESQTADTEAHPYLDAFWSRQPETFLGRVHVPVLGCVDWQDTTAYSRGFDQFRELNPATTWLVGGNGTHYDCPTSRAEKVRFFNRYLKGERNGWPATPHLQLIHEVAGTEGVRDNLAGATGAWQSSFRTWSAMDAAIHPVALHLHAGGRLDLTPPALPEAPDRYVYPTPTANTPEDWTGRSSWSNPTAPGGAVVYTTAALTHDAEFLGSGSGDLWISSTAVDTDVQITLSEVRPDGHEMYVENGWLRLSDRRLVPGRSTPLLPYHPFLLADVEPLIPAQPALARIELLPFDYVFRAGSAIRLSIDSPGGYFQITPTPALNQIYHQPAMDSKLVLGWLPGATAHAPRPPCGTLLNQPCRANAAPVPSGSLTIADPGS